MHDEQNPSPPEEGQQQTERQFRLLVQSVTDYAIFMLNPRGDVVSWNAGAQRCKGYETAEILGQHFSRFYTEEDRRQGTPDAVLKAAQEMGRYESEGTRCARTARNSGLTW